MREDLAWNLKSLDWIFQRFCDWRRLVKPVVTVQQGLIAIRKGYMVKSWCLEKAVLAAGYFRMEAY